MRLSECNLCSLAKTRTRVVTARGDDTSGIMMIGEAPGQDENASGQPFVGRAGKLLSEWIAKIGGGSPLRSVRENEIYITNVVKCWPPSDTGGNRTPVESEIQACSGWLDMEIKKVAPWLIVALGATAAGRVTGNPTLGERVGTLEWSKVYNTIVLITYHPAYLLRNAAGGLRAWKRDFAMIKCACEMTPPELQLFKKEVQESGSLRVEADCRQNS